VSVDVLQLVRDALVGEFGDPDSDEAGRLVQLAEIVGGLEPVYEGGDRVIGIRVPGGEPADRPAPVRYPQPLQGMTPTYIPGHGEVW
jgi:hypothetical protein